LKTDKKNIRYELKWRRMGFPGRLFLDSLFSTTRIEQVDNENVSRFTFSSGFILAFRHSRITLISYIYKGFDAATLVSQSEDGEVIAMILPSQGHETIRGSTTRGGCSGRPTGAQIQSSARSDNFGPKNRIPYHPGYLQGQKNKGF
jgi:lysophospholipid acyltransferase (LPLAT)-like uncharacterized protein